jgi:hypothetical protein
VAGRRVECSTRLYTATGVVNSGRPSGPVGPPTRTIRIPAPDHDPGALSSGDSGPPSSSVPVNHAVERPMTVVIASGEASDGIVKRADNMVITSRRKASTGPATASGSSTNGQCPLPSSTITRALGKVSHWRSACSTGMYGSWRPQTTRAGRSSWRRAADSSRVGAPPGSRWPGTA